MEAGRSLELRHGGAAVITVDLAETPLRDLNGRLHELGPDTNETHWRVLNPDGAHAVAAGLQVPIEVEIDGHVGYYCAGMNKDATIRIKGNAGTGLAENMMSGRVVLSGNASQSAGATGKGGLLVIEGDASSRCGISMKGIDIVVKGSVGHMSAFMAQAGTLVICGDAGDALGDSLYEARIFVKGRVASLGADCVEKKMRPNHLARLSRLLKEAGCNDDPKSFRRYGSARKLYNFHVDHADQY
jgi:methylamine---glutamate N-methyltransferase subunit B